MATRTLTAEDWSPVPQGRQSAPAVKPEPREERLRLSSRRALQPKPLNIVPRQPRLDEAPEPKALPSSRQASSESCRSPKDPEVVDAAPVGPWPRRDSPAQRKTTVSRWSQCSARPSEESFGILDYYRSLHSPELPPPTPKADPAIGQFDFDLPPTPTIATTPSSSAKPGPTKAGPTEQPATPSSASRSIADQTASAKGYSLFPQIKQVTPPARHPAITHIEPIPLCDIPPTSTTLRSPQTPDPTHRPRKQSHTSSLLSRPRTDSLLSTNLSRQHSSTTTAPSPTQQALTSRWSDDSSTLASPPSSTYQPPSSSSTRKAHPRPSLGSFPRRDSVARYPACFFEDDDDDEDEGVPLRRAWRRQVSFGYEGKRKDGGGMGYDGREGWAGRLVRLMLCGCGGR